MAGPGLLSSAFTTRFLPGLLKGEQAIIGALSRCGSVLEPSRRSPPSTSTIDQVAADASAKPDTLVQQHWRKHASDGLIVPWAASSRLAPEVPKPTIALWNHQLVSFSVAELLAAAPRPSPMQAPSSDLYSVPLQEVPVPVGQESGVRGGRNMRGAWVTRPHEPTTRTGAPLYPQRSRRRAATSCTAFCPCDKKGREGDHSAHSTLPKRTSGRRQPA